MNRDQPHPPAHGPGPEDLLLRRYHEANALDSARPDPALRDAVLTHARSVAAAQSASRAGTPGVKPQPAANDHRWAWRALGSVAVLGLVGLLVLQFDRGTPEEREAAFGLPAPPSAAPAPEATPPAADTSRKAVEPAPVQEAAPAPKAKAQRQRNEATSEPLPATAAPPAPPPAPAPLSSPRAAPGAPGSMRPAPASPLAREEASANRDAADAVGAAAPAPAPVQAAPMDSSRQQMGAGVARRGVSPAGSELLDAAARGNAAAVRSLLAQGVDVNSVDADGRTALMWAARRGDAALIRLLLGAGADLRRADHDGRNASEHARQAGEEAVLPLLRVDPDR
ncbi:ankyrin repeat domain-containing protein [Hydrogenophaga taeniospiralis]|uniref:ankyrin repeat domain-containing protein n=1 Tax=Hydrogenophaga taeniospiralis TaxID=65656 RepID=UPI001CFC411C|nr:ankyrin repeat domain-containing protein [Hydrogenophaga taeniospiralis]MCB4365963.1 ankyrin repeat domain-containing protein [Hydrogenophaga taeniospiralis]